MRYSTTILVALALFAGGCAVTPPPTAPPATPVAGLQRRAITSRDLGKELQADYLDLWWATITVLQDAGFVLRDADQQDGFIYGAWLNRFETRAVAPPQGLGLIEGLIGTDFFSVTSDTSADSGELDFNGDWNEFTDIEVSVTFERRGEHSIVVRLSSRFGWDGSPQGSDEFASRFFGAIRKEVFLRRTTAATE